MVNTLLSSLALLRHQRRLLPATRWAFLPHAHMRDETLARALYAQSASLQYLVVPLATIPQWNDGSSVIAGGSVGSYWRKARFTRNRWQT